MARVLVLLLWLSLPGFSQCISISDAAHHVGQKTCVAAKVVKVTESKTGALQLEFCATPSCPFTVRVFPVDFDYVGDVRQLEGKEIEIVGKIREKNGQYEMILKDSDQLRGDSSKLAAVPKTYDVERRGNFSPGTFKGNQTTKRSHKRPPKEPSEEIDTE